VLLSDVLVGKDGESLVTGGKQLCHCYTLFPLFVYGQVIGLQNYQFKTMHVETACTPVRIISFHSRLY